MTTAESRDNVLDLPSEDFRLEVTDKASEFYAGVAVQRYLLTIPPTLWTVRISGISKAHLPNDNTPNQNRLLDMKVCREAVFRTGWFFSKVSRLLYRTAKYFAIQSDVIDQRLCYWYYDHRDPPKDADDDTVQQFERFRKRHAEVRAYLAANG